MGIVLLSKIGDGNIGVVSTDLSLMEAGDDKNPLTDEPNEGQKEKVEIKEVKEVITIADIFLGEFAEGTAFKPNQVILGPGEDSTSEISLSFSTDKSVEAVVVRFAPAKELGSYKDYNVKPQKVSAYLKEVPYSFYGYNLRLVDLVPDSEYIYSIGNGEAWTAPLSFKTLPSDAKIKIGFFGDLQGYKQSQYDKFRAVYEEAVDVAGELDLTLLAGDIVDKGSRYDEWKFFDKAVGEYTSKSLFAAAPGNHDVKGGAAVYENTFLGPLNGVEGLENRNYWFDVGSARVAVLDTESPSRFDEQEAWLKEVMGGSDKSFKWVLMHRSAYPMAYDEGYIRAWAKVFEQCDIDLVLSGHDHIYSRTTVEKKQLAEVGNGVTYVCGGSASGSKYYDEKKRNGGRYWEDVVYDTDSPVFSVIELSKDMMSFTAYTIREKQRKVIDYFELRKTRH